MAARYPQPFRRQARKRDERDARANPQSTERPRTSFHRGPSRRQFSAILILPRVLVVHFLQRCLRFPCSCCRLFTVFSVHRSYSFPFGLGAFLMLFHTHSFLVCICNLSGYLADNAIRIHVFMDRNHLRTHTYTFSIVYNKIFRQITLTRKGRADSK